MEVKKVNNDKSKSLLPILPHGISLFKKIAPQLCNAIDAGDVKKVNLLLSKSNWYSIDPNELVIGMDMSFLHLAVGCSKNSVEIVTIFLGLGGDPNSTKNSETISPLHLSAMNDFDMVMDILLTHGGDPNIPTGDGKSCFHLVAENASIMDDKCFELLYRRYCSFRTSLSLSFQNPITTVTTVSLKEIKDEDSSESTEYYHSCESSQTETNFAPASEKNKSNCNNINLDLQLSKCYTEKLKYSFLTKDEESKRNKATLKASSPAKNKLQIISEESDSVQFVDFDENSSGASFANSTPPLLVSPTCEQLKMLQEKMKKLNIPVTHTTYPVLSQFKDSEAKIVKIIQCPSPSSSKMSNELYLTIQDLNLVNEYSKHHTKMIQHVKTEVTSTAKKASKSYFNYLLLQPKIVQTTFSGNHLNAGVAKDAKMFQAFLSAIFYVGKGRGKRPLQHLVDAKAKLMQESRYKKMNSEEKVDTILNIWKSGMGVVVLSVFHHSSELEANINEAAMIDAFGLNRLSNMIKGSYGASQTSKWSQKIKNQLGSFLLYKSFCAFVVSNPKYFYPQDM